MRVTYVGNFDPVSATSSALRIRGVVSALEMAGVEVAVVLPRPGCDAEAFSRWPGQWIFYDSATPFRRVGYGLTFDRAAAQAIEATEAEALIVYGTGAGLLRASLHHGRRCGIPVIADVVEWYQGSHMTGGRVGPWSIANLDSMRRLSMKVDRAVVISKYLARHYESAGLQTLVTPPLFPTSLRDGLALAADSHRPLRLCFAGTLGGKDARSFTNALLASADLDPEGEATQLHVVGPTRRQLEVALGGVGRLPRNVMAHGRLNHQDALAVVANCHFTVLQRPTKARYAQAGFPSKVAESLVLGTPIVSNLTSDLDQYLVDGYNAVVLAGDTLEDMLEGLRRAANSRLAWSRRQIQAHADTVFNPQVYAHSLAEFMSRPRLVDA